MRGERGRAGVQKIGADRLQVFEVVGVGSLLAITAGT